MAGDGNGSGAAPDVEVHTLPHGTVTLDARCFPVLIIVCVGPMDRAMNEIMCDWLDRMLDRACTQDVGFVVITDARSGKPPRRDDVRYAMQRSDARHRRAPGRELARLAVVEGALMRALATLALRLSREPMVLATIASFAEAAGRARAVLEGSGFAVPGTLEPIARQLDGVHAG